MNYKEVPIEQADVGQLRKFALESLGLDISQQMTGAQIRAKIALAWDKPYILAAPDLPRVDVTPLKPPAAPKDDILGSREMVTVYIQPQEGPGGEEPVPLSVNGRAMWVKRGVPSRIRVPYFEVLNHSIRFVYPTDADGNIMPPRAVHMYPFSVQEPEYQPLIAKALLDAIQDRDRASLGSVAPAA